MKVAWLALPLLAWAAAQQPVRDATVSLPPGGTGVITGIIVAGDGSGTPIRRARVMANTADLTAGRTTTSSDDGRFVFTDLAAGRYTILATKAAYLTATFGATKPGRAGIPVVLGDGQHILDLEMKMTRGGVVAGRVTDPAGQPAAGVAVSVLRYSFSPLTGERMLNIGGGATTDDTGIYRVFGLMPGDYVAVVTPPAAGWRKPDDGAEVIRLNTEALRAALLPPAQAGTSVNQTPTTLQAVDYAPVYFPGTVDMTASSTISVVAGEERGGIDLQLQVVPTARIRGRVTWQAAGKLPSLEATLSSVFEKMRGLPAENSTEPEASGEFHFSGVAPGPYVLLVRSAGDSGPTYWATADLAVNGRDLDIPLELQPSLKASAKLVFEGTAPPSTRDLNAVNWVLPRAGDGHYVGSAPGHVDDSGRLTFEDLIPGRYSLIYSGAPAAMRGWVLKSSAVRGKETLDGRFDLTPAGDLTDWVLTYTDHPSQISGTLESPSGRLTAEYFIIVFSTNRADWVPQSRRVAQTRPGNDGRYTVTNLPAGEYWIAAVTDLQPTDLYETTFIESLVPGATKFTLGDGQRKTQDLRIAR